MNICMKCTSTICHNDLFLLTVVADASSTGLVKDVLSWKEDVTSLCTSQFLPFMLLVNKMDWSELGRKDIAELREMSEENGFVTW